MNEGIALLDRAWFDIADQEGQKIRIFGWMKTTYCEVRHKSDTASYGISASLTDGNSMCDVRIKSYIEANVTWKKEVTVEVIGVRQNDKWLNVQVDNAASMRLSFAEPLDPDQLMNVTSTLAKTRSNKMTTTAVPRSTVHGLMSPIRKEKKLKAKE